MKDFRVRSLIVQLAFALQITDAVDEQASIHEGLAQVEHTDLDPGPGVRRRTFLKEKLEMTLRPYTWPMRSVAAAGG